MAKKALVCLVAFLCAALVLGGASCGNKDRGDPKQVVMDFWDALQGGDFEKAVSYLSDDLADTALEAFTDQSNPKEAAMIKGMLAASTLVTTGSSVAGDNATVDVEVTMPDMDVAVNEVPMKVFEKLSDDVANLTDEQIMEEFAKMAPEFMRDMPTVTEPGAFLLVATGLEWRIEEYTMLVSYPSDNSYFPLQFPVDLQAPHSSNGS
ncbi:MAG: DUF4878 domain-containing protein [Actinobacteria bacterium]|nr:DUF4878 domain-containing protein [Actinomycetota bacterium]